MNGQVVCVRCHGDARVLARAQHGSRCSRSRRLAWATILGLLLGRVDEQAAELLVVHGESGAVLMGRKGRRKVGARNDARVEWWLAKLGVHRWMYYQCGGARGRPTSRQALLHCAPALPVEPAQRHGSIHKDADVSHPVS